MNGRARPNPGRAANDFFPTQMTPKQNPFYLDLPVIDRSLKNRWVQLQKDGVPVMARSRTPVRRSTTTPPTSSATPVPRTPGSTAPASTSRPALNGCLGFSQLNGASDRVDWRFVEQSDVPAGPWTRIITTNPVVP